MLNNYHYINYLEYFLITKSYGAGDLWSETPTMRKLGVTYYELGNYEKAKQYIMKYLENSSGAGLRKNMLKDLDLLEKCEYYKNGKREYKVKRDHLFKKEDDINIEIILNYGKNNDFKSLLTTINDKNYSLKIPMFKIRRSICLSLKLLRQIGFSETSELLPLVDSYYSIYWNIKHELLLIARENCDLELLE